MTKILFACFALLGLAQSVSACIHPDSAITVRLTYTDDLQEAELRFGNLELMNEIPGILCSCGLIGYYDALDSIQYIAIVDSGTNDLYQNFKPWVPDADATTAWSTFTSSGDIAGFVGEVFGDGLTPGDPVDMIIRMDWSQTDSLYWDSIGSGNVGQIRTDMLDLASGTPTIPADHLGIWQINGFSYFPNIDTFIINVVPQPTYFDAQDSYILDQIANWVDPADTTDTTSTNLPLILEDYLEIYPNPASESVTVKLPERDFQALTLTGLDGKRFAVEYEFAGSDAILIPRKDLSLGMYVIEMIAERKTYRSKVYFE